jgi:hypothetical protein
VQQGQSASAPVCDAEPVGFAHLDQVQLQLVPEQYVSSTHGRTPSRISKRQIARSACPGASNKSKSRKWMPTADERRPADSWLKLVGISQGLYPISLPNFLAFPVPGTSSHRNASG